MIERGFNQGYVRLAGQAFAPNAVQWWLFRVYDDGWAFARGGRCRTIREARALLRHAREECSRERHYFLRRPTTELTKTGELIPVRGRSPYEAVKEMIG